MLTTISCHTIKGKGEMSKCDNNRGGFLFRLRPPSAFLENTKIESDNTWISLFSGPDLRNPKANINNFSIAKMNVFYTVLRKKHGKQHIQQKGFSLVNLNYQRAQVTPMREDRICDQGFGSAHPTYPNENWVFLGTWQDFPCQRFDPSSLEWVLWNK